MAFIKRNSVFIALILAGICFWLPLVATALTKTCDYNVTTCDFYAYYIAGKTYLLGLNPYYTPPQSLMGGYYTDPSLHYSWFIYPPTFMLLWAMFATLSYATAQIAWGILNCVIGAITLYAVYKNISHKDKRGWVVLTALMMFFSAPLLLDIRAGNASFLIGCLMTLGSIAYMKDKKWVSALILVLAAFLKVFPIFLIIILIVFYRDWRFIKNIIITASSVFLSSLLFIPSTWYTVYLFEILPRISGGRIPFYANQSIFEMLGIGGYTGGIVLSLGFFLLASIFIYIHTKNYIHQDVQRYLCWIPLLIGSSFSLLLSGMVWSHTFVILIFPLSFILIALFRQQKNMWFYVLLVGAILTQAPMFDYVIINKLNGIGNILLLIWAGAVLMDFKKMKLEKV